ncbi:hypothetical protein BBJ29_009597 [Phytophthora kernoviae]|uniref:Amino acid transporter transmembrane domain-containing protein n=1 Tax=Phytophthora kernoviae TaxID=325452 RepID=A0A3F2RYS8_9STRA|nr:hypothetical protein BBJ29_009597 [Phytophthora kernoviae]RLN66922.1 hypothetical protein BBP00_00001967 [Phytophthora kernoviae]
MIGILLVCYFSTFGPISGLRQTALSRFWYVHIPMSAGASEGGSAPSFGATVFGFAIGWTSYAAEYTVYHSVNQSKTKVFFSVYLGLIPPLLFTQFLGIAIMTATDDENGKYAADHNEAGSGGLIVAVIVGPLGGFGQFCLVLLALPIITNYCPNIYSFAITMQHFYFRKGYSGYSSADYDNHEKLPRGIVVVFSFCVVSSVLFQT